ncbi:MAG: hypothetical protein N4A74_11590 [Carboxylicivirga sp.]|jgi:hypothetical protein|nr:hypothetical protein [Carboxylicivirga sp.]
MKLSKQRILVVSPEPWGKIFLSKHHYVMELLKKGNKVYFLSQKSESYQWRLQISDFDKNLIFISYPAWPLFDKLRFHSRRIYHLMLKIMLARLWKYMDKPDVCISFDCNGLFPQLNLFRAKQTLFFPVDQIRPELKKEYKGYDHLLSISPLILEGLRDYGSKHLLHHGLNAIFADNAKKILEQKTYEIGHPIKVAYVGNLLIGDILDKDTIRIVIQQHPAIEFHFYGPYEASDSSIGANTSSDSLSFINFLQKASNCHLHGTKTPGELVENLNRIDAFMLCYNNHKDKNKGSNAHKIMEYLSFGKICISTNISMFNGSTLLEMLPDWNNTRYQDLFTDVINKIEIFNAVDEQKQRILFASSNQYSKKINQLDKILKS